MVQIKLEIKVAIGFGKIGSIGRYNLNILWGKHWDWHRENG